MTLPTNLQQFNATGSKFFDYLDADRMNPANDNRPMTDDALATLNGYLRDMSALFARLTCDGTDARKIALLASYLNDAAKAYAYEAKRAQRAA